MAGVYHPGEKIAFQADDCYPFVLKDEKITISLALCPLPLRAAWRRIGVPVKTTRVFCFVFVVAALSLIAAPRLCAQNLTLEGQTGGFITPTAYAVYTDRAIFSRIRLSVITLSMRTK